MTLDCYDFCLWTLGRFTPPKKLTIHPIEELEGEELNEHQILRRNRR